VVLYEDLRQPDEGTGLPETQGHPRTLAPDLHPRELGLASGPRRVSMRYYRLIRAPEPELRALQHNLASTLADYFDADNLLI
jgi:hypothetical protein